ncbi:thermonuclease family protein [Saccharopolyspora sp. NPDC049357]|uniref:thermonuclease family protein n=1 Tax=Saccharopolyspora sp. NPDC049357 TaxID=3154507 RepID=UPI0034279038
MRIRYYPPRHRRAASPAEQKAAAQGCGCLFLGFIVLAAFGSCVGGTNNSSPGPATPGSPTSVSGQSPTPGRVDSGRPPEVEPCTYAPPAYDGTTCFHGGELARVTRVIDGDTVELADRRHVRLLGVDAPEASTCAGPGATAFTRGKVEGKWVLMYREPGASIDEHGRELAYLQPPSDFRGIYHPAVFQEDLGYELTFNGWAEPFANSDANATYDENVQRVYETASHSPRGMFAAPCGSPETYTPPPNYDYPNPDGGDDGESRLCRGKWYC